MRAAVSTASGGKVSIANTRVFGSYQVKRWFVIVSSDSLLC